MIIAQLTDGRWVIGIEEKNVELLKQGKPMVIKFSDLDRDMKDACMVYGKTLEEVKEGIKGFITEDTIIIDKRGSLQ